MSGLVKEEAYKWNSEARTFVPASKLSKKFLKGPVPWDWISAAARLPGAALHIGVALWRLAGVKKLKTVRLTNAEVTTLGISRGAKYRALDALSNAGLINIESRQGCAPLVTILDV